MPVRHVHSKLHIKDLNLVLSDHTIVPFLQYFILYESYKSGSLISFKSTTLERAFKGNHSIILCVGLWISGLLSPSPLQLHLTWASKHSPWTENKAYLLVSLCTGLSFLRHVPASRTAVSLPELRGVLYSFIRCLQSYRVWLIAPCTTWWVLVRQQDERLNE